MEFAVGRYLSGSLTACAFCPVLPSAWSSVIFGVSSLVYLDDSIAFRMKHQEESENIKKAKTAIEDCRASAVLVIT
ncbi:MAG: hypothetical protein ACR5K2_02835 [Wolbachia sp.]